MWHRYTCTKHLVLPCDQKAVTSKLYIFWKRLTGWNLLSPETIVAQENCSNNWIIYIRTVVQFETVPSTESMLLEDFVMSIPIFKGNNIITKLKSVNVTEIWSLVTIQEHQHLTRTLSLTTQTLHKDSTFRKKWHTQTYFQFRSHTVKRMKIVSKTCLVYSV